MREKVIEQKLTREVKRAGGICPKFVSPGFAGMPGRLILFPDGMIAFAELKAPGKKPLSVFQHRGRFFCFLEGVSFRAPL